MSIRHADECGCPKCEHKRLRILAFGAIRRAAEVARQHERTARIVLSSSTDFARVLEYEHKLNARSIRRAIRAAIGSDKS